MTARFTAALIAVVMMCAVGASAQKTTRRNLQAAPVAAADSTASAYNAAAVADTLRGETAVRAVAVTGYEKPLRSTKETMFIANRLTDATVTAVIMTIDYSDMRGHQLHRRTLTVPVDIAPGQRRLATVRSWDHNKLFYYHINTPRTTGQATPYSVRITVDAVIVEP